MLINILLQNIAVLHSIYMSVKLQSLMGAHAFSACNAHSASKNLLDASRLHSLGGTAAEGCSLPVGSQTSQEQSR